MKKVIIVGSGAGGAAAAKELQGKFLVTILEAGKEFKPFSVQLSFLEKLRKTGLFYDEREIQLLFPAMKIRKTQDGMVLVNGNTLGGSTTLSAGNALRMDGNLKDLGIDLEEEFRELYQDIPITYDHQDKWCETTKKLYKICEEMNLDPKPLPKFGNYKNCTKCGRCILGCQYGVKWDSRHLIIEAQKKGSELITGCRVFKVVTENGTVMGVSAQNGPKTVFYPADIVILAAGGFSTPIILQNSGIECENRLFVDPVLCIAAEQKGCGQNKELSMPFAVQREHYIVSPYFDYLSFFFNKEWSFPAADMVTLMIKLADSSIGNLEHNKINKTLTKIDKKQLQDGVELCIEILSKLGIKKENIIFGTVNAGHPGGMLPLTEKTAETLHDPRLPDNLYVADASLIPTALGNPAIFTIMALSKRVSKMIIKKYLLTIN